MNVAIIPSLSSRQSNSKALRIPINKLPVVPRNKLPVVNTSNQLTTKTTINSKGKLINSKIKKTHGTRAKIKDYMQTETPLSLTNCKSLISSLTNENVNKTSFDRSSKTIINLFSRKVILKKNSTCSSLSKNEETKFCSKKQQKAKSTIKDYLQIRTLSSTKCSKSNRLRNKENFASNY